MIWISVKDRLPQRGEKVLIWIEYSPPYDAKEAGYVEIATFRLKRSEWDETVDEPLRPQRIVILDPVFHWSGGDADCEWRQSEGFAKCGGYSGELQTAVKITHWMPLPVSPSGWVTPPEDSMYWEEEENVDESS